MEVSRLLQRPTSIGQNNQDKRDKLSNCPYLLGYSSSKQRALTGIIPTLQKKELIQTAAEEKREVGGTCPCYGSVNEELCQALSQPYSVHLE